MRIERIGMTLALGLGLGVALNAGSAWAQAQHNGSYVEPSLRTGVALEALDQNGHQRTFTELSGKQGLIVAYGRRVDQCAVCQERLAQLDKAQPDFAQEGFNLAAVTPDSPEALMRFASRRRLGIALLSDPDLETLKATAFDEEGEHGHDADRPAVALLGADGRVLASLTEADLRAGGVREAVMAMVHSTQAAP